MTSLSKADRILSAARIVETSLRDMSRPEWADSVRDLATENTRLRSLVLRAADAMSRREPDGISDADWDQLLGEMRAALGMDCAGVVG